MALRVLTVDDSKTIRMIVKKAFKPFKCELFEAENGVEGLSIAGREKPDLIILDITMPVMTGTEMLEKMKVDPLLRDTPVIMLTAESGKENVMKIVKMGVKDYMVKPFKGDQLIDRVAKIFALEEKTAEDEPVDTSKLYFTSDGDFNILTMPEKITRGISSDIEGHLDNQIKEMLDNGKDKFIMDMCEVQEINISLIKLIVLVIQTCNKANIDVQAAGTSTLSDGLKEFAETSELLVSASIDQAKKAF
jgi:CheY-like chemotaxis protein